MWIEIDLSGVPPDLQFVTPCAGVWIEISRPWDLFCPLSSLPVRECGLKSVNRAPISIFLSSLPVRECGLKFVPAVPDRVYLRHSLCGSVD